MSEDSRIETLEAKVAELEEFVKWMRGNLKSQNLVYEETRSHIQDIVDGGNRRRRGM